MAGIGKGLFSVLAVLLVFTALVYFAFSTFFRSYYTLPKEIEAIRLRVEKIEQTMRTID